MKTLQLAMIMTLSLSVIFLIASQHAFADTCSAKLTSYNAPQFYLLSDGVFAGTVQHIDNTTDHQWKVHFTVDKLWRGSISQKPLMVMTNSLQGCGYSIVQGEKYLVYTNGYPPFFNTVWSKPYADAQSDIVIIDDPKFQSDEKTQEELNKKLVIARDAISNLMGSKMGDIPFNSVGVDVINSTLDIGIDSAKAVLSEEAYEKKIKDIVGDIPIKITFGQIFTDAPIVDTLLAKNYVSVQLSPLQQFKSGIAANDVKCNQGLQLIFKQENMSPICVKPDTSKILIERGWASQTLGISFGGPTYIINATQPKVTLYDYSYNGIDKDNTTVSINNQTYYQTTLDYTDYDLKKGASIQFQNVTFAFPQGIMTTPGGAFIMLDMKFQDGSRETYGESKINQDGSWAMGGIQIPTQYGPSSAKNSITVLSNHLTPQAGLTIYNDKIKLLVSTDNQASQKENTTLPASFEPCDTPYPQSNTGVAVLYMPTNSIGKICVRYSNPNDTPEPMFGIRIFDPNNSYKNATGITTWSDIGNNYRVPKGDSTVVYWIKIGNQTGFYGLVLSCVGTPFAVGYDNNSKIVSNDFPFLGITNSCPVMLYGSHIDSLTGIGVKYIPYP